MEETINFRQGWCLWSTTSSIVAKLRSPRIWILSCKSGDFAQRLGQETTSFQTLQPEAYFFNVEVCPNAAEEERLLQIYHQDCGMEVVLDMVLWFLRIISMNQESRFLMILKTSCLEEWWYATSKWFFAFVNLH